MTVRICSSFFPARLGLPALAAWTLVAFFLEAVEAAALQAGRGIVAVASLVAQDRRRLLAHANSGPASYRLFELLPTTPRFIIEMVRQRLDTSFPTATAAVKLLQELGIVNELTGQKKNRSYSYSRYIELLAQESKIGGPPSSKAIPRPGVVKRAVETHR
ncbi:hypothetical protein HNP55_003213 [Paucibacter oligotrophus]|uniref:Filamentation induced by cAMP protein Fic n=1 Tax=Roseateles oligotrophus TaxID=1769250 RepID=A0A840LF40_9BURK|nr:hypothetical protein [Roseateles oligotrophus]MBB4844669.1 hypothetical protein [Roseateles oligotrophus]